MPDDAKAIIAAVRKVVNTIVKSEVLVGIPAGEESRPGDPINNAALGYLFEYGDPASNMPPRPWLEPSVRAIKDDIVKALANGGRKAIAKTLNSNGNVEAGRAEYEKTLHRVGLMAQNEMRRRVTAGIAPELSPRTVYARLHRKKKRRSPGPMTPLIDTGQWRNSISYVIRLKK